MRELAGYVIVAKLVESPWTPTNFAPVDALEIVEAHQACHTMP